MAQDKIAVSINLDWPLKRYHELYKGIQDYAINHTDWLLIWDHFPEQRLKECDKEPYYQGIIGRIKFEAYEEIKRLGIPAVNTWATNSIKDMTSVLVDFGEVGKVAAEHLIKKGYRNFVHIDYRVSGTSTLFYEGFMKEVKKFNSPVKRYYVSHKTCENAQLWKKFNKDFRTWMGEWQYPMAIVTSMSSLGAQISACCLENGLRIPEDVAIVSNGNDLSYCEGRFPTISSVDINYYKVGYESAKMLDRKMKGDEPEKLYYYIKPRGIVARESTDSYAVKDNKVKEALRFISDHYNNSIQVIDVVDAVSVSRSTLERKFQNEIGHSIFDEINRLRVSSVKRLLIETDDSINDICKSSGFSSPHHLRRAFYKDENLNPAEFRKLNKS